MLSSLSAAMCLWVNYKHDYIAHCFLALCASHSANEHAVSPMRLSSPFLRGSRSNVASNASLQFFLLNLQAT
jgi:hypothetical protein